jgi:hypothetical protein
MLKWSSAILATIFQAAFLSELQSAISADEELWWYFGISVVFFCLFLYSRATLSSRRRWRR